MVKSGVYASLAGLFVSLVMLAADYICIYLGRCLLLDPYLIVVMWPSSIMLMGTAGQEFTPMAIVVTLISVMLNVALYFIIGAVIGYLYFRKIDRVSP